MSTNTLRQLNVVVERCIGLALIAVTGILTYAILPVTVLAADLSAESTSVTDPTISHAAATYTITQSTVSLSTIRCIAIEFDTAADGSGTKPTAMDITAVTFSGSSNYVPTPASWTVTNDNTAGTVELTFAAGETPPSASARTIILAGIVNSSTPNETYFTLVNSYSDIACTAPVDTNGQSTFLLTSGATLSVTINPTLTFTVDSTTCDLGTLTITTTGSCSHTMTAASNAIGGYAISYLSGATLMNGANTIAAMSGEASVVGTPGFGLNFVANTVPSVGANATGTAPTGAAIAPYATANNFTYNSSGAIVATSSGATNLTTYTASYIANISATTPAGQYTKTQTYSITATY